jgi:hypothetical protein
MEVERPRHEAADQRAAGRERAMPRGREMNLRDARLKSRDRESEGIDRTVPADHIERRMRIPKAVKASAALHQQVAMALVARSGEGRTAEVAV